LFAALTRKRGALSSNALATFSAQVWSAALTLLAVPVYLRVLGPEVYGIIGFYVALQILVNVLDFGWSMIANREFARAETESEEGAHLLRTLEVVYGLVGVLIVLSLWQLSSWLSTSYFNAVALGSAELRTAIVLIGLTLGLRWPVTLYTAVLRGLERHVLQNTLAIVIITLRTVGAMLVIRQVPTLEAFFYWQALLSVAECGLFAGATWLLQHGQWSSAKFDGAILRRFGHFSAQLTFIALFAALLKQVDRLVLGRWVSLDLLGYYTVAAVLSGGLLLFATPLSAAVYPRFSDLFARDQTAEALEIYRKSSRTVAVVIVPVACMLVFFASPIVTIWTRSGAAAQSAAPVLAVLAAATALNSLMQVPYAAQIAAGRAHIALWTNGVAVAALTPLTIVLVQLLGIAGAGIAWLVFNIVYYSVVAAVIEWRVFGSIGCLWRETLPLMGAGVVFFGGAAALAQLPGMGAWWSALALAAVCAHVVHVARKGFFQRTPGLEPVA
jgi:O-antigen/teichoic acid export membrane protein